MTKKIKRAVILFMVMLLLLNGCKQKPVESSSALESSSTENAEVSNNGQESREDSDDSSEASSGGQTSEEDSSNPSETSEENQEQISFSTPGGAVIIGTVGRDGEGWFMIPEQVLSIELTCFEEQPLNFQELTRIHMFESSEDGMDKSIYLGKTVTVEGQLRIYRDYTDRLYLLPYTISIGKTAEKCCAAPNLAWPEQKENQYDPFIPLPEKMQVEAQNGQYVYNPYALSTEILEAYGNDFADFYVDFVDAFLNYQTTVVCTNKQYAEMLNTVLFYEFPMFSADCTYQYVNDYNKAAGTITLHYSVSESEHKEWIRQFTDAVNGYLQVVDPGESDVQKAKAIYHALCIAIDYDYAAMETREGIDAYNAYVNQSGVCTTFAIAYSQLLTQVGIKSTIASGEAGNDEGHVWTMINVAGINYFCDPTYECGTNDGNGYVYFGLSYADRIQDGTGQNGIFIGKVIGKDVSQVTIADESL